MVIEMATVEEKKYTQDELYEVIDSLIDIFNNRSHIEVYHAIKKLIEKYNITEDVLDNIFH